MAVHLCTCIYNCESIFTTLRDPCTSAQGGTEKYVYQVGRLERGCL